MRWVIALAIVLVCALSFDDARAFGPTQTQQMICTPKGCMVCTITRDADGSVMFIDCR